MFPQDPPCHKLGHIYMIWWPCDLSLVTLPVGTKLTLSSLDWVILVWAMQMSQAEDIASCSQSGQTSPCPTKLSPAAAARLVRPLGCLPALRGCLLQASFLLAAGQFHFLVDTQTTPKQQQRLS